jgi:hypothetical protein
MIGNSSLQMAVNGYAGMTVRIVRGAGAGQERSVVTNDLTTITVPKWSVEPDATSFFTVAEAGWHFAAVAESSPIQFPIPNRTGEVVQITGRSANVNNLECSPQLATVTRWTVGGSGIVDTQVPPQPFFGLGAESHGSVVVLSGVSFSDLTNTISISSGTLTLHYWDELTASPSTVLATNLGAGDQSLTLMIAASIPAGTRLQVEEEIVTVTASSGLQYFVTRAVDGSVATAHTAGTVIYPLANQTTIVPFPTNFFGSRYGGNWTYPITLPDVRVVSAELFVTNRLGNSQTTGICFTETLDRGLRTLSGGQYSIQVEGYLAVEQSVAPPIVVEASRSVRDVFGVLGSPADSPVQVQVNLNGAAYCTLTFAAGAISSSSALGTTLPFLPAMSQLTVAILSVGQTLPGADLTVTIRL